MVAGHNATKTTTSTLNNSNSSNNNHHDDSFIINDNEESDRYHRGDNHTYDDDENYGSADYDTVDDFDDDGYGDNYGGTSGLDSDDREYESPYSPLPSPLPHVSATPAVSSDHHQTRGLHHRRTRRQRYSPTSSGNNNSNHPSGGAATTAWNGFQDQRSNKKRRDFASRINNNVKRGRTLPFGRYIQSCLIAGIPAYLVGLLFFFYSSRNQPNEDYRFYFYNDESHNPNLHTFDLGPEFYQQIRDIQIATVEQREQRHVHFDQQERNTASTTQQERRQKAITRRSSIRPPATMPVDGEVSLQPYSILTHEDSSYLISEPTATTIKSASTIKSEKPAPLEDICGIHAQNASLQSSADFRYKDALTKKARVLITGIVSTPTGYRLAHALRQRCGVRVMIGFDELYPNSLRNRLRSQEQMAYLTKHIPKIVRPFFSGHVGLDPYKHAKNFHHLHGTSELDLVRTFQPTHIVHLAYQNSAHVHSHGGTERDNLDWKNTPSPYVQADSTSSYDPPMFVIQNGLISMEQILSSIANAPPEERPHFVYASSLVPTATVSNDRNYFDMVHEKARTMDEVLANFYYRQHEVYSVGIRMPTVYGPWDHSLSPMSQVLHQEASLQTNNAEANFNSTILDPNWLQQAEVDLMHVDDVVDAIIATMQYRPVVEQSSPNRQQQHPPIVSLSSGETRTLHDIQQIVQNLLNNTDGQVTTTTAFNLPPPRNNNNNPMKTDVIHRTRLDRLRQTIGWFPQVSLADGLARTLSWHMDRIQPYGPPPPNTRSALAEQQTNGTIISGDALLKQWSVPLCRADDILCHGGQPVLPCASECAVHKPDQCLPTFFDKLVPLVEELTEECDIVLYTQDFHRHTVDLELSSEFMEEGDPLVCNFAFINQDSNLTSSVIEKVPDGELKNLGFELSTADATSTNSRSIRERKLETLNGRLLYRGWILVWAELPNLQLRAFEDSLLKLSPGRFLHKDVKVAVFIDQQFGVSPRADDIAFLAHEMYRKALEPRVAKRKTRPKAKFLLPPEPERQAVILLPELKYLDSPDAVRLPPGEKISIYEATRFMRFEVGEKTPLKKEPVNIKMQREFYERVKSYINPDIARSPNEPSHKFELHNWVRTRWVAHDLKNDQSRTQLRCPWYQEHSLWGTPLDQLSLAYVLEKLDLQRKLDHKELDDIIQKQLSEKTEMKKLLSDAFEWISLETELHKSYSPYEEMQILPYDMDYVSDDKKKMLWPVEKGQVSGDEAEKTDHATTSQPLLFIRLISDRIMAQARKAWNSDKKRHSKRNGKEKSKAK